MCAKVPRLRLTAKVNGENRRHLLIGHASNALFERRQPFFRRAKERREEDPINHTRCVYPLAFWGQVEILTASQKSVVNVDLVGTANNRQSHTHESENKCDAIRWHTASVFCYA